MGEDTPNVLRCDADTIRIAIDNLADRAEASGWAVSDLRDASQRMDWFFADMQDKMREAKANDKAEDKAKAYYDNNHCRWCGTAYEWEDDGDAENGPHLTCWCPNTDCPGDPDQPPDPPASFFGELEAVAEGG